MTEVILSSDSLTVLGGPSRVNVEVDFGPTGQRGSQIFVGNGKPNLVEIGQTPRIFDLYINILASDDEYLSFYQYQTVDGISSWVRLFSLITNTRSLKQTQTFTAGETEILVPIASIVPLSVIETVDASNFNVQYSIHNSNVLSSSITVGDPEIFADVLVLPITIKAFEYVDIEDSGPVQIFDWQELTGSKIVDLIITVV